MTPVIVASVLACAVAPCVALAQDEHATPSAEIQALLREALAEFDRGNYAEAYSLFARVDAANPSARTERALGNTAYELRRYVEAIGWLEAALADERNPLTPEMRAEAEGVLTRARGFVGRFSVRTNVEGASIELDGEPLVADAILLAVGEHEVIASAEGYVTVTRRIAVRGGEEEEVTITLRHMGGAADPAATDDAAEPPASDEGAAGGLAAPSAASGGGGGENPLETWWFWSIIGLVVSGTGVGIGAGVAVGSTSTVEAPLVPPGGLVMALVSL